MSRADLSRVGTPGVSSTPPLLKSSSARPAPVIYHVAHLPCDVNQDGVVNISDSSAFGAEWNGARRPELIDTNRDGTVNISDSTAWGQLYTGSGSFIMWNGKSLPPQP